MHVPTAGLCCPIFSLEIKNEAEKILLLKKEIIEESALPGVIITFTRFFILRFALGIYV